MKKPTNGAATNGAAANGATTDGAATNGEGVIRYFSKFYFRKVSKDTPFRDKKTEYIHMKTIFSQVHVTLRFVCQN